MNENTQETDGKQHKSSAQVAGSVPKANSERQERRIRMQVFNKKENWSEKVNFVDENNVVLGYDLDQCCCENADWFIADRPMKKIMKRKTDNPRLSGYVFDIKYFESVQDENEFDEGGMAIFRIINGKKEKFIHIYNSHNGYYSHGFEFKAGQQILQDSAL